MEIVIVFDNYRVVGCAEVGWGYACFLPAHGLLFDTGSNPFVLLRNLDCLKIREEDIRLVALSHFHWDHIGGLFVLLERGVRRVVLHRGFSPRFADEVSRAGGEVVWADRWRELFPGVHYTGPLSGRVPEAGLVVEAREGPVLVTGCAHPGPASMVQRVREHLGAAPRMIMGGLHLFSFTLEHIAGEARRLRELGVQAVVPCHCSGDQARGVLARVFGEGFLGGGVGFRLSV